MFLQRSSYWMKPVLWGILLQVVAAMVFSNAIDSPMFFDDYESIIGNPSIREFSRLPEALSAPADNPFAGRPLVNLLTAFDWKHSGASVQRYHTVNLSLHGLASLAIFLVASKVLQIGEHKAELGWVPYFLSLIWLLHPLNVEVISYVTQRTEILASLFILLSFWCALFVLLTRNDHILRKIFAVMGVVLFSALGALSKETAVVLPVVVLLFDISVLRDRCVLPKWERASLYLALCTSWGVVGWMMTMQPRASSVGFNLGLAWWEYALMQVSVVGHYLFQSFVPSQTLVDYGYQWPVFGLPWFVSLFGLLASIGFVIGMFCRGHRQLFFIGTVFFVLIAPTSSFVPIVTEVGADRRVYLAMLGPLVLALLGIAYTVSRLLPEHVVVMTRNALLVIVVVCLGVVTRYRNEIYSSNESAWRHACKVVPWNSRAYSNLAVIELQNGRPADAMRLCEIAVKLDSEFVPAALNLFNAYIELKLYSKALDGSKGLIERLDTLPPEVYCVAIRSMRKMQQYEEAIDLWRSVPSETRDSALVLLEVADVRRDQQNWEEATKIYEQVIAKNPSLDAAFSNLGTIVVRQDPNKAIEYYRSAVSVNPRNADAYYNMGLAHAKLGNASRAVWCFQQAIEIRPGFTAARYNLEAIIKEVKKGS